MEGSITGDFGYRPKYIPKYKPNKNKPIMTMGGIHLAIVGTTAIPVATASAPTHTFQGTVSGYSAGGGPPSTPNSFITTVDKFPLATDANATAYQNLTNKRHNAAGASSETNGYIAGGNRAGLDPAPPPDPTLLNTRKIDKFPFATNSTATSPGNLTMPLGSTAGHSSSSEGWVSGGEGPPGIPSGSITDRLTPTIIQRYPFATDASASTYPGNPYSRRRQLAGFSSTTNAYNSGGTYGTTTVNANINKFPFATVANATNAGNLSEARGGCGGVSSNTSGYTFGGLVPSPPPFAANGPTRPKTTLDKFPFATDANASNIGGLSARRDQMSPTGVNSTTSGYALGGVQLPGAVATIDKFPFATDASATNVASLSSSREMTSGVQD